MALPPKEYIAARRKEIHQHMQVFSDELRLLDKMESAITGQEILNGLEVRDPRDGVVPPAEPKPRMRFEQGIKGMVLAVLDDSIPLGLSAMQMLTEIKKAFGYDIPRTSLSPQLSRLKREGFVGVSNSIWQITNKGREALK